MYYTTKSPIQLAKEMLSMKKRDKDAVNDILDVAEKLTWQWDNETVIKALDFVLEIIKSNQNVEYLKTLLPDDECDNLEDYIKDEQETTIQDTPNSQCKWVSFRRFTKLLEDYGFKYEGTMRHHEAEYIQSWKRLGFTCLLKVDDETDDSTLLEVRFDSDEEIIYVGRNILDFQEYLEVYCPKYNAPTLKAIQESANENIPF